ncbi:MAG: sodium transporter [Alphaproteobacteria bacterium RIFCSPHIGHO2_12_FULL_63_12]|nr:MAG: sodium transporter [Alphaproteobacteria bacterium RIFCSPHIGHO2_12_FULL_63_12]
MSLESIDLIIIAGYAFGLIALATVISREKTGRKKDTADYFLAGKALPWWAIGASLIAANISAEQVIGMAGSGYAVGLAIASYEWLAAATLIVVAKFFLPIFLKRGIYTMPQFLEQRFGASVKYVMSVFWLALYTFVNLTTILWLGATAINTLTGVDMMTGMILLAMLAAAYSLYGGLKAVAMTDIIQVALLIMGGLIITNLVLAKVGDGDALAGFAKLSAEFPEKFQMILSRDNPEYRNLPGIGVILGGMWVMHFSYWGCNQYIIQRALGAKDVAEAQKGLMFAAILKLFMPLIIVVPGIAAFAIEPNLSKPDQAYPEMMKLVDPGWRGVIFAALIAAIVSSLGSMMNSISTIFTMDLYRPLFGRDASERQLVRVGRITSFTAVIIALVAARPLLAGADQVFQIIQEYTGFFTPGIVAIFVLGLFWRRSTEIGALAAVIGSFALSLALKFLAPQMPFMDRVGVVFLICVALGVGLSYLQRPAGEAKLVRLGDVSFRTDRAFNIGAVAVCAALVAIYAFYW